MIFYVILWTPETCKKVTVLVDYKFSFLFLLFIRRIKRNARSQPKPEEYCRVKSSSQPVWLDFWNRCMWTRHWCLKEDNSIMIDDDNFTLQHRPLTEVSDSMWKFVNCAVAQSASYSQNTLYCQRFWSPPSIERFDYFSNFHEYKS